MTCLMTHSACFGAAASEGHCAAVAATTLMLTLLALPLRPEATPAEPLFAAPFLAFDTGVNPRCTAIGDLNGDGAPDVVTANDGSAGSVSVLLGLGNSSMFGARADYATGSRPQSVAIADLNGDGRLDVVTANLRSETVSVLLGLGNGTLGPASDYVHAQSVDFSPSDDAIQTLDGNRLYFVEFLNPPTADGGDLATILPEQAMFRASAGLSGIHSISWRSVTSTRMVMQTW